MPGLILALLFVALITLQLRLDPGAAPADDVPAVSTPAKLYALAVNILPMSLLVAMVIGLILFGIATPTESAAFGTLGLIILAAAFRQFSWTALETFVLGTMRVSGMVFFIIMASAVFSNLLAFYGATRGLLG